MNNSSIKALISTSGWMYNHWKGPFYPEKFPNSKMLKYYVKKFDTVEINSTFYRLPSINTVQKWMNETPEHFIFAIKANQFITHRKYLKDGQETTKKFFDIIKTLNHKLGPILFQLPPNWRINIERLKEFVEILPKQYLYTFEMRNASWYIQEVFDLLKKYNIALCIHDFTGDLLLEKITANFVYLRFHGPLDLYYGKYSSTHLNQWAEKISKWLKQKIKVFAYFNNDAYGWAVENALEIKKILDNYDKSRYEK
ncbi:MAG: DUF72 domain-containing protein [Promethearchaeota archaeon]